MSVLGWVSQDDLPEYAGVDAVDETCTVNDEDGDAEEGDGSGSDSGSDTESEYDFNVSPMSSINELGNDNSHTDPNSENCSSDSRFNESERGSDSCSVHVSHTNSNGGTISSLDPSTASTDPTIGSFVDNQEEQTLSALPNWHGFKLVGDNIDKNVRPSFSRSDKSTLSLHCFHYYAVLDRVNLSSFSDITPQTQVDVDKLLISHDDIAQLEGDAVTLISR